MSGHRVSHDHSLSVTATSGEDFSSGGASAEGVEESRSVLVSRDGRKVENGSEGDENAIVDALSGARTHWLESHNAQILRSALLTLLLALERDK